MQIAGAISKTFTETGSRWIPARRQKGEPRQGAEVADLTDLVEPPGGWPEDIRLIVRREPLHPAAAQHIPFPSTNDRYWGH